MNGWMDRLMDGWMNGCMQRKLKEVKKGWVVSV